MGARQASQPSSNKMIAMSKDLVNLGFTPTRYYRGSSKLLTVNACSVQWNNRLVSVFSYSDYPFFQKIQGHPFKCFVSYLLSSREIGMVSRAKKTKIRNKKFLKKINLLNKSELTACTYTSIAKIQRLHWLDEIQQSLIKHQSTPALRANLLQLQQFQRSIAIWACKRHVALKQIQILF